MRTFRTLGFTLLLGTAVACHDVAAPTRSPSTAAESSRGELAAVSRALAVGLSDPAARAEALRALRASPWTQHRVRLDELLDASPTLAARLQAALPDASTGDDGFAALEVVMPMREHRRSWAGGPSYLVQAGSAATEVATVYDRLGAGRSLASLAALGEGEVLLRVQPAAERQRRMLPDEPLLATDAVEAANDRLGAMIITRYEPSGDSVRVEYLTPTRTVEQRFASGIMHATNPFSPPAPPPRDTLYLSSLVKSTGDGDCEAPILGFCDEDVSEVEVILTVNGVRTGRVYLEDAETYEEQIGNRPAMAFEIPRPGGPTFRLYVAETDAGDNNDDLYCNYEAFPEVYSYPGLPNPFQYICDDATINGEIDATHPGQVKTEWAWTPDGQKNPPRVTSVTVTPATRSMAIGGAGGLTANAYNQAGGYMNYVGFDFASNDEVVAIVTPSAYNQATVTARGYGTAIISATATSFGGGVGTQRVAVCPESGCSPVVESYFSHFADMNCGGAEYYYTAYNGGDGIRRSWNGKGATGNTLRNVTVRSYKDANGNCTSPWGSAGYTFNGMVSVYRAPACGEASCTPVTAAYISHFANGDCTGTEYYYTPYYGYDGVRRSWNGTGLAGSQLNNGVVVRSWKQNDSTGCRPNAWGAAGNTLNELVRIYR